MAEPQVTERAFKAWVEEKQATAQAMRHICLALALWVTFLSSELSHARITTAHQVNFALETDLDAVEGMPPVQVKCCQETGVQKTLTLDNVHDAGEIMEWVTYGLVPHIWRAQGMVKSDADGQDLRRLGKYYQVLGVRVGQTRVRHVPCSLSQELRNAMEKRYGLTCASAEGPDGPADVYEHPDGRIPLIPRDLPSWGKAAFTPSDERFDVTVPIDSEMETVQRGLVNLTQMGWMDDFASSIDVELPFLGAQVGYAGAMYIKFSFTRGGGMVKRVSAVVLALEEYPNPFVMGSDIAFGAVLVWMFISEFRMMKRTKDEIDGTWCETIREYFTFTTELVLNWSVILLGGLQILSYVILDTLAKSMASQMEEKNVWDGVHSTVQSMGMIAGLQRLLVFWYSLILVLYWSQSFEQQPRLAVLLATLRAAAIDLVHFMVLFLVAFFNFVVGGYVLFGSKLRAWSTLIRATSATFQAVLGNFEFAQLYDIAPVSATCWFWLFMVTINLCMFNLLIAVMLDHFALVCQRIGFAVTLPTQAYHVISDMWFKLSKDTCPRCGRRLRRKNHDDIAHILSPDELVERAAEVLDSCAGLDSVENKAMGFVGKRVTARCQDIQEHLDNSNQLKMDDPPLDMIQLDLPCEQSERIEEEILQHAGEQKRTYEEMQVEVISTFTEQVSQQVEDLLAWIDELDKEFVTDVNSVNSKVKDLCKDVGRTDQDLKALLKVLIQLTNG